MTRTLTACLIVAARTALAGCGSSSSGLAKSELASKADAICSSYTKSASAIPQPKGLRHEPRVRRGVSRPAQAASGRSGEGDARAEARQQRQAALGSVRRRR